MRGLRRSPSSPSRRRRTGLFRHLDRRPHRGALVLAVEIVFAPPYWLHAALWLPLTTGLAVGLLQPIKGAIVAWQWANYMHGFDPEAETEAAEADNVGR